MRLKEILSGCIFGFFESAKRATSILIYFVCSCVLNFYNYLKKKKRKKRKHLSQCRVDISTKRKRNKRRIGARMGVYVGKLLVAAWVLSSLSLLPVFFQRYNIIYKAFCTEVDLCCYKTGLANGSNAEPYFSYSGVKISNSNDWHGARGCLNGDIK